MKSRALMYIVSISVLAVLAVPLEVAAQSSYQLIDLGTFGGPASFINPPQQSGSTNPMSLLGTTVGGSTTSTPTPSTSNFFLCGGIEGIVPNVNHAFKWDDENGVTDLGSLGSSDNCSLATSIRSKPAAAVNISDEIVGSSENGVIDPVLGVNEIRAILWKDGQIADLGTLGGNVSAGSGINNRGQIVGFAVNDVPDPISFYYDVIGQSTNGTQTRAFLWQNGTMTDLGTLGGPDAWADFINDHGQVSGFSYTGALPNPMTGVPATHPFLWDSVDGMIDLGTLGGSSAGSEILNMAGALNNRGHVVGASYLSDDQTYHPFFWKKNAKMYDLGTLGGSCGAAFAVNDADVVVGRADVSGSCSGLTPTSAGRLAARNRPPANIAEQGQPITHAFLWQPGMTTLQDLGTIGKGVYSQGNAINSSGQVVGASVDPGGISRAFLWENGGPMVDLNTLIPPNSALKLRTALAINDRGEIAGIGVPTGCLNFEECGHAFVLIPTQ